MHFNYLPNSARMQWATQHHTDSVVVVVLRTQSGREINPLRAATVPGHMAPHYLYMHTRTFARARSLNEIPLPWK